MCAHWGIETFEAYFADVLERKSFAEAQFGDCVRDQDLFRLRMSAETRGQLNRRSKEIVVLFNGLAGCGANPNFKPALGISLGVLVQFTLDLNRAADRARYRNEGGHNPVPIMLYFASAERRQSISHNNVVYAKDR